MNGFDGAGFDGDGSDGNGFDGAGPDACSFAAASNVVGERLTLADRLSQLFPVDGVDVILQVRVQIPRDREQVAQELVHGGELFPPVAQPRDGLSPDDLELRDIRGGYAKVARGAAHGVQHHDTVHQPALRVAPGEADHELAPGAELLIDEPLGHVGPALDV